MECKISHARCVMDKNNVILFINILLAISKVLICDREYTFVWIEFSAMLFFSFQFS